MQRVRRGISMGPELETKEESDSLATKENGNVPGDGEDRLMQCTSNREDTNFYLEPLPEDQDNGQSEEVEVNIISCPNCADIGKVDARCEDATESMSSFGDTDPEAEDRSMFSDVEVESPLYGGDEPTSICDKYLGAFPKRKRKLTDHWRRFIHPLMWRCKWLELRMKELQAQALKYDKELAENEQRKQFDYQMFLVGGFDAKSQSFSTSVQRKKVTRRKKRKRIEETIDVALYMSQHNLFSYFENKKSAIDGADNGGNIGNTRRDNNELEFQNEWTSFESKGVDKTCEFVLQKIETLKLQVRKLKARIEKVMSENPGKFSSLNRLILPACDALTSSEHNPASPLENGDKTPKKPIYNWPTTEGDVRDLIPKSAVANGGKVTRLSGMIENSHQPLFGVSCENEGNLIHNQAAKEEIESIKIIGIQTAAKEVESSNKIGNLPENPQVPVDKTMEKPSEANLQTELILARVQYGGKTLPKSRSTTSKGKRKRGKRKPGGRRF